MTNYFKVYLKPRKGNWRKEVAKTPEEVRKILRKASSMNYEKYTIIKRIKERTDVPIASGYFSKECQVVEVEDLDVDYRIVGHQVVIYDQYIKSKKKGQENER